MKHNTMYVDEMIPQVLDILETYGYSKRTLWMNMYGEFSRIKLFYQRQGTLIYAPEITEECVREATEQYREGRIQRSFYNTVRKQRPDLMSTTTPEPWSGHVTSAIRNIRCAMNLTGCWMRFCIQVIFTRTPNWTSLGLSADIWCALFSHIRDNYLRDNYNYPEFKINAASNASWYPRCPSSCGRLR